MIIVAIMYMTREVLIPLALAGILSFMLAPPVRMLQRLHLPRAAAVVAVVALAFALIFVLGRIMAAEVRQLADDLPRYQSELSAKIKTLRGGQGGALERAQEILQNLGDELTQNRPSGLQAENSPSAPVRNPLIPVEVHEPLGGPVQVLSNFVSPLLGPLATTVLIVVFVIFMLIQREDLRNRLISVAGSTDIPRTIAAIDDAAHRLSRLFLTQLTINTGFGIFVGLGLWWIGIPNAFIWGVLAGVLRFIPFIGPVLGLIFPLVLAISVGSGWSMAVWTAALFIVLEGITGQVIEPIFEGHTTGLSPVAIVVTATFWAWLWGPVGLVLATPLTVILVVLGRHFEFLKFFDVLFGDEPALSEPQVFYQRMLARDPVEAIEHAKGFMGTRSLSKYCDEVALPGLTLAHNDAERGALDMHNMENLRATVEHLFADIAHEHRLLRCPPNEAAGRVPVIQPHQMAPNWLCEGSFVSIGAYSALDEAAASVIATLARAHGLMARTEKPGALSATQLGNLDLSNAALICLSCVGSNKAAHINYAARRIKSKAPHAKLLLGVWTATDDETLATLQSAVNADYATRSFHETLLIVLNEAAAREPSEPAPCAVTDSSQERDDSKAQATMLT
ncbi:MAG: AI-2E family transporter [Alphaproteobacteria bacterium]|nr:AI-2E family transporter [Alphaproteobacteria bacterium]